MRLEVRLGLRQDEDGRFGYSKEEKDPGQRWPGVKTIKLLGRDDEQRCLSMQSEIARQRSNVWQFRQEMVDDDGETRLRQIQADQTV